MGLAKELQILGAQRGWRPPDAKAVCSAHLADEALKELITSMAVHDRCDFCDSFGTDIAADLETLVDHIGDVFRTYWANPNDEGLPFEGDFIGHTEDTQSILSWHLGLEDAIPDAAVREAVADCFEDEVYCETDYFSLKPDQALRAGWENFAYKVKHETRYLFFQPPTSMYFEPVEGVHPAHMLDRLGRMVIDEELLKTYPAGTIWYRARARDVGRSWTKAEDLGTAPVEAALFSNRMSAAGVPMFYGAKARKTALAEVWSNDIAKGVSSAGFRTLDPMLLLDLTAIPDRPSIFRIEKRQQIYNTDFLSSFTMDLAKPIKKDGREHIEYVPTQVVTDYFRSLTTPWGDRVDGLVYPSSQDRGGTCCVLFVDHDHCYKPTDALLSTMGRQKLSLAKGSVKQHEPSLQESP